MLQSFMNLMLLIKRNLFLKPEDIMTKRKTEIRYGYYYYGCHYKISYKSLVERQDEFIAIINEYRHAVGAL